MSFSPERVAFTLVIAIVFLTAASLARQTSKYFLGHVLRQPSKK